MNDNSIYEQIIDSKTGIKIPLLKSGRTVESRYDPQRDCNRTVSEQLKEGTRFVIVLGIAGGVLINTVLQETRDTFILGVEYSQSDIDFLTSLSLIQELKQNERVCLCPSNLLEQKIKELYVPAFYGNLQVIEQRGWIQENPDAIVQINKTIEHAISLVAADFSVQSHFGKLWQHNIIANLKAIHSNKFSVDTNKTAVVVAAGPTLDQNIHTLKQERNSLYIIATDTAYSILISYNIIPDAVVSIDGQNISNAHFIHQTESNVQDTLFLFDLCANPSAVKKTLTNTSNLIFFHSGHPFVVYLCSKHGLTLPQLCSGSGTVTISALDFAFKCGFTDIQVYGADFSYSQGKPYAKGTYLDRIYGFNSKKIFNLQKQFSFLMFRTPLINLQNHKFTTTVLDSYRASFEEYLKDRGADFIKENDIYKIKVLPIPQEIKNLMPQDFDLNSIVKDICNSNFSDINFSCFKKLTIKDISLLPLISWFRYNDNKKKEDFKYYYNLAINYFKKYL